MSIRRSEFDDLRPYYDEEVGEALARVAADPKLRVVASYLYPDMTIDEVKGILLSCRTTLDFQHNVMSDVIARIVNQSTDGLTCSGLDRLEKGKAYLFVSNHRDIMLDAAFLEYLLDVNGMATTEITFGENLMSNQFIIDIGKCNRMFKVARPGSNAREFYMRSSHLSDYIRYTVTEKKCSVWIAQRNGRTKDGNDATDQGIIKMFGMSLPGDKVKALAELNIVPMSISYEWEPCDKLKALELLQSMSGPYIKKPGEDLNSILTGVTQRKGRVHIEVCSPITPENFEPLRHLKSTDFNRAVARLIDSRILPAYRLFPNNYIAHDIVYGCSDYAGEYSEEQKAAFMKALDGIREYENEQLEQIFLGIYSNPVDNRGL